MVKYKIIWSTFLVCVFVAPLLYAKTEPDDNPVVSWLDWSTPPISPVARPFDFFFMHGNALGSGGNFTHSIAQAPAADDKGLAVLWRTRLVSQTAESSGYAFLRFAFPDTAQGNTVGVILELVADRPGTLTIDSLSGSDKSFWNYSERKLGTKTYSIPQGRTPLRVIWNDMGVSPDRISALGITLNQAPVDLGISRISFIMASPKAANEYRKAESIRHNDVLVVMLDWIKGRGVDLMPLQGKVSSDNLEILGWQAIHILAIKEQLENIPPLASAPALRDPFAPLKSRMEELQGKLIQGQNIKKELDELQNDIDPLVGQVLQNRPVAKRRWSIGEDQRFHRPDGRPFRMFAPHFFRSLYPPPHEIVLWRPWDIRYLAAMGFNGLRLHIVWAHLEPEQGRFNEQYLQMLIAICREAERYGLAVSVDLHWPFPDWFMKGKPGMEPKTIQGLMSQNPYHWPEALLDVWNHISKAMSNTPNIVAWEVPTNEPALAASPGGVKDYPAIHKAWNDWLKREYTTREALQKAWNTSNKMYSLKENESWDTNSIEPLGYQGDGNPEQAYLRNPRLWDHIRWAAWMQEDLTGRIMQAIRKHVPDAVGMMQYTIGDQWDASPVPIDYHSIQTCRGPYVQPGTHYGVGSLQAVKAASLTQASYDSEQHMENNLLAVQNQVRLGLGFCPFAFHRYGEGGMLFQDDDWHLKHEVAYLPKIARWVRTYTVQPQTNRPAVALVTNTRQEATIGNQINELSSVLHKHGLRVGVFEGLAVVASPELLTPFDMVITSSSCMDPRLLDVLDKKYKGRVLLFGRLDADAWTRCGETGLAGEFARRGILLKSVDVRSFGASQTGDINLAGSWDWRFVGAIGADPTSVPIGNKMKWSHINVPGKWGEIDILGTRKFRLGDAWYRKKVFIPAQWKGQLLRLQIGAIDDLDWTFFNGKLIGKTMSDTPNYWCCPRDYAIPADAIRWGEENVIDICVRNTNEDGGIWKGPVKIVSSQTSQMIWRKSSEYEYLSRPLSCGQNATRLTKSDLRDGVDLLAFLKDPSGETSPAFIRDGRWLWWVSPIWSSDSPAAQNVLDFAVKYLRQRDQ